MRNCLPQSEDNFLEQVFPAGVIGLAVFVFRGRRAPAVLKGSLSPLKALLIFSGKFGAFLALVIFLSILPSRELWSFLIGFLSFVPGALVYELRRAR